MNVKEIGTGKHDQKVMDFIDYYWKTQFRPPSVREIMTACGIGSTFVTTYVLRRLASGGKYEYTGRDARGIVPAWVKDAIRQAVAK